MRLGGVSAEVEWERTLLSHEVDEISNFPGPIVPDGSAFFDEANKGRASLSQHRKVATATPDLMYTALRNQFEKRESDSLADNKCEKTYKMQIARVISSASLGLSRNPRLGGKKGSRPRAEREKKQAYKHSPARLPATFIFFFCVARLAARAEGHFSCVSLTQFTGQG